jgi:uncharacterized protein YyaL (SSP411 family)
LPNRLAQETSPYLLQHKDNPVDWYPWGPEALAKAKSEDKPILVSIGYSACHWCHVMAHESFENEQTAAVMNDYFVNIKVDREERPDLDSIYMSAVQAMSGHGGWPLNCFLTPDGVPFFGGTYWPREERMGMPTFKRVLEAVHDAYTNKKAEVLENAEQIRAYLDQANLAQLKTETLTPQIVDDAVDALERQFDAQNGGFGGAPKFPQPAVIEFLVRVYRASGNDRAKVMATTTLDKMATGGIYDQIGGGFHRYAVDAIWLVPHFEKMAYDNAQLARLYLDAYRAFKVDRYRDVATETLDYVLREMTGPDGGFYSTQDADSEGEEGKFYVWSLDELVDILGERNARWVAAYFGATKSGNFEGRNILHTPRAFHHVAAELEISPDDLKTAVEQARPQLLAARNKRIWPGRDEKVLTGWNGMMLRAFAEGSRVLDRPDFLAAARANADFLLASLRQGDTLFHTFKDGRAKVNAFLEDYANLIDGLISLYEASFERRWIEDALSLAKTMKSEFAAEGGTGFFDTGASHETLVSRPRDLQDGATPAGNSVAASVLLKLSALTENADFHHAAAAILGMVARPMAEHPTAFGRYLSTLDAYLATPREVAIAGNVSDPGVTLFANVVFERYEPNAIVGLVDQNDPSISELLPFLANRPAQNGKVTAYLCERYACLPPVTDPADLAIQLEQGTGVDWQEF